MHEGFSSRRGETMSKFGDIAKLKKGNLDYGADVGIK